ncbi:hypothetical protein CJD38_02105 [Stenotrophobium rhamnosiphilum]|uniref:Glycosyl transferase family 1 n=2 Tax=Stenotrophobium rhamnosiphilum TaxID=2029166 RepID=A0A2T5MK32_9GAMM|nr:hypothetical protein CJD38_02105 [Stenotrophobium rhamnosiphilum]
MTVKLNIIVANDSCEVDGGAALVALEDAQALARKGHRVIFFSACGTPPVNQTGIEWISLGQRTILDEPNRLKAAVNGLWNASAANALGALLTQLPKESTIVHLHGWSKALSGSVVSMVHRKGFRLVCTLHDYFSVCPNGGLYDYPTRRVCTRQPMSMSCVSRNCDSRRYAHKVWRVVRQFIWRYGAGIPRKFDLMIAVSKFSAEKIASHAKGSSIEVVDNLPTLQQSALQSMEQRSAVVYAGRIAAEKGVDLYLEACRIAQIPAEVWGDGPLLPELRQQWPDANFSGWLPKAELTKRLQKAQALVLPSLWYENSPMIIAEAAAAGVPVIVSDHGAPATLVEDGVTGLHFRAGDAADLAEKVAQLHKDPQYAHVMGQTAYKRFWMDYDARAHGRIEQIEACYQKLLGAAE